MGGKGGKGGKAARDGKQARRRTRNRESAVASHTNRMGDTYYLHRGLTKTGKPKYFAAKSIGQGALPKMPEGFEFSESINAIVSVRRVRPDVVPAADVALIEQELRRFEHLQDHEVRAHKGAIVIYAPNMTRSEMTETMRRCGSPVPPKRWDAFVQFRMSHCQYGPVMKFEPHGTSYATHRMTYRGHGGWSEPLRSGALSLLARRFICHIGTDEFFEL